MNDSDPVTETSKAIQETAKASGKALDATRELGHFLARFISGSLTHAAGIVEDKLWYMRWERQQRLIRRAEEYMKEIGLEQPTRALPMKFAIPLMQAASMEDDDELQDLWAKLLINAANENSGMSLKRAYIDILESIGSLEATIVGAIYGANEESATRGWMTRELPARALPFNPNAGGSTGAPNTDVELALANLARLGCLVPASTFGGGFSYSVVNENALGRAFFNACTLQATTRVV